MKGGSLSAVMQEAVVQAAGGARGDRGEECQQGRASAETPRRPRSARKGNGRADGKVDSSGDDDQRDAECRGPDDHRVDCDGAQVQQRERHPGCNPRKSAPPPQGPGRARGSRTRPAAARCLFAPTQVFGEIGREQLLRLGGVHQFLGDQADPCVDPRLDGLPADVLDRGFDSEVPHADRILQHQPIQLTLPHRLDRGIAGIDPTNFTFPAIPRLRSASSMP